jgi:DNA-binding NarL/FixJ family response regulator
VARVLALVPDLLFGSNVQGALAAGGHEIALVGDEGRLRAALAEAGSPRAEVLLVDLTDADLDGPAIVESLRAGGQLAGMHTLGFYSHVDGAARTRAESAGFDQVVPRSRMAREGAALVARLAGEPT